MHSRTYAGMFRIGNWKLDKSVLIFSMTTAKNCPAKAMGLCKVSDICYAAHPEVQYKSCLNYRERQAEYWKRTTAYGVINDIREIIRKRPYIKYFRFNENGDFRNQDDVDKLSIIALCLLPLGIKTYGYTARHDLNFDCVKFHVRFSGLSVTEPNKQPRTIVINKPEDKPKGYHLCKGKGCGKECKVCMETNKNVAFLIHGPNKKKGK